MPHSTLTFLLLLAFLACVSAETINGKPVAHPLARVKSIRLSEEWLYPSSMRGEETCFGNSLAEVGRQDWVRVTASRPFSLFLTTEFADSPYNLQQYYGESLQDITLNTLILSSSSPEGEHYVQAPLTLKCKNSVHPYFRLKASLSVRFYLDGAEEKFEYSLLLVCARAEEVAAFSSFYVPGYVIFWLLFNLALQVYHNHPRGGEHFAGFLLFLLGSLSVTNDLLAYCVGGAAVLLVVLRERSRQTVNTKMFTMYICFGVVVALQAVLTFQGGKLHQLLNSFWIALDNFIVTHIAMFMALRLIKLSRLRHVFWYLVAVSLFSIMYSGNNRFFQLQFKNPLDLTCIRISVFLPIMMLPISNYFCTLTSWMHRAFAFAILLAAVMPVKLGVAVAGVFTMGVVVFQVRMKKDFGVIRHRC